MLGAFTTWLQSLKITPSNLLDWGLVVLLIGFALYVTRRTRAVWLVRGYVILLMLASLAQPLELLNQVLDGVLIGAAVALAVLFQPELRRMLEQLGRGDWLEFLPLLVKPSTLDSSRRTENALEELILAIKDLSQNRTGALIVIELEQAIDERIFTDTGVTIQGQVSKELLQTIFQTSTLLHDGAVLIAGDRLKAAGVILPVSERVASRQLGTRHRAAMGITEQASCLCIVVSEETGSISLAEAGRLQRPLTSSTLRDALNQRLRPQRETSHATVSLSSWATSLVGSSRRLITALQEKLSK
ncbi:MAG: diadenylate cyclase CdaA [Cyanobacteria bacterium P01_E01_bin.34]